MSDVLEELSGDTLTREQVERRVEDWARRIEELYGTIGSWLPPTWSAVSGKRVQMYEEPMREVGLPPRDLPVLTLMKDGEPVAAIEPRGLWIIGANGRLDLTRGDAHYLIVDTANNFDVSRWRLASLTDRRHHMPLDQATLSAVL